MRIKASGNDSEQLFICWSTDGKVSILKISETEVLLCSTAKFSDYEVHCVSSVIDRNGNLWILTARMNFMEAFKVEINGDSVFIDKNSHTTIKTSNSMKFLAIEAKLISGTVRCTATSQEGYITTIELTGQNQLRNFGAVTQVEKPDDSRIISAVYSPHATTLCVDFNKSTIIHKVCDKGVAVVNWFAIMDDSEYEQELAKVITSGSFGEEMLPSLVDFVLPMTKINSTFFEIQRCLQLTCSNSFTYFLNRILFSSAAEEMDFTSGSISSTRCPFCNLEYELESLLNGEEESIPCIRCKMPKPFIRRSGDLPLALMS